MELTIKGGGKGFWLAVDLIPYVAGMLLAIGLLRASGAFDLLMSAIAWLGAAAGFDTSWLGGLPQGLMKMFSGSGARAFMLDAFKTHGPDSFAGRLASIIQGASDTTFYVLAACAGAAKLRDLGHAIVGAVLVSASGFTVAVLCARLFFG